MKNLKLLILLTAIAANSVMAAEKVTLEMANEDMRKAAEGITYVDSENGLKEPNPNWGNGGNSGEVLEEVWTGSAASVPATWGQGDYYVEISFGHNNQGGSAWLTIDNSSIKKSVAIPSPLNYEGNYYITYETGTLATYQSRTKGKPKITRISKLPTPQLNDCTAGQTQSNTLYCASGKTCETGKEQRLCASNGGWGVWQTIRNPICVAQSQSCP